MAVLDDRGHEVLDATPVAMPVGWSRPPSLQDQVRRFVRQELSRQAAEAGMETFEEADDFDVGDDFEPSSPWELTFDQEMQPGPEKGPSRASVEPEVKPEGKPEPVKTDVEPPGQGGSGP